MPIVASCQCGAKFAAQDHLAGKTVRCPKCAQPLQIPNAASSPTPTPQPRQKPPAVTAPAVANVGGLLDEMGMTAVTGVRCPQCSADTRPDAVICVKCGYNLQRGRQLKVESDSLLQKKREAMDARKARAADRNAKRKETIKRVGSGDADDLGGVTEGSTAILMYPIETFQRLSTVGSTRAAFEFAFVAAFFIGLFWMVYFSLYFLMSPMAAIIVHPERANQIGQVTEIILPAYLKAILWFTVGYFACAAVLFGVFAPAMAGGAHLILTLVGKSQLGYGATLRVILYTTGAAIVMSGIPCVQIFAPLTWLVNTTIGLAVHHRVNGGVAVLAMLVGYVAVILAAFVFYILLGAFIGAFLVIITAPRLLS